MAVIGLPDEPWGGRMPAIIVAKHCRGQIAGYKCLRSVDFHDAPLPLTGAGEVLKRELRGPYWKGSAKAVN